MIEKPILGEPFEVWVKPEAAIALMYYKDAARRARSGRRAQRRHPHDQLPRRRQG
ncbi:MAG: hypothetical protein R2749_06875 [Acidimicrobiales bacterium]